MKEDLLNSLDKHPTRMSRVALRNAIEHFDKKRRVYYLGLKG